jgi:predicted PP-loop superfamily ATPase
MNNRCINCLIKENTRLLYDFFAVSQDDKSENTQQVKLNENQICQYCETYKNNYDKDYLDAELEFFSMDNNNENYHSIVALSGGKDSISALYLAKKVLGLNVIAMTYDNGFIPKNVIEQSERICKTLNVPYIVYKQEMYNEFKNEYKYNSNNTWVAKTGLDFCNLCSKNIWKYIKELSLNHNIYKVILGNKIYSSLTPKVSSIKKIPIYVSEKKIRINCINLLFSLNVNTTKQKEILDILDWESPKLKGYTSNCLIPGFTEYPRSKKIKTDSDAGYIEMELRSGIYSLEEAKKLLFDKEYIDNSDDINLFFNQH